uniref:Envelope glycoprotein n=1 Tax=Oreochromis niloticus TaxID=8128 RepID=A0A669CLG5_ORENI
MTLVITVLCTLLWLVAIKSQVNGFNPCNGTAATQVKTTADLYLCYNQTSFSSTVWIPLNSFHIGGYLGSQWPGYDWYLSSSDATNPGWDTVFTYTGNDWTPTPTQGSARNLSEQLNLTKTNTHLVVNFHTTSHPLLENPPKSQKRTYVVPQTSSSHTGTLAGSSSCYHLTLFIYKSGKDPHHFLSICNNLTRNEESNANTTTVTSSGPALTKGPLSTSMTTVVIAGPELEADDWFRITTGISGHSNNWLLLAEQAARDANDDCMVCLGPRPTLRVVPAPIEEQCLVKVMNSTNIEDINPLFNPVSRADIWWWCGDPQIYDRLPRNKTGMCGLISLLLPVQVIKLSVIDITMNAERQWFASRKKRSAPAPAQPEPDPTYIDAIGVPRGVPDEYKLVDQVAAGFESSVCWWCTINKNVDRINYVHYNVQRLGNLTMSGLHAVAEQLRATSLMSFQNRVALDMLLSEKNGVCSMFGEQCCTFIPNNTAADGSLTRALEGLKTLNEKMKEHSGVDTSMWDSWMDMFGKYRTLVSSILVSMAVFAAILTLCGCCCIPCIRALINRLIATAITPHVTFHQETMMLLTHQDRNTDFEEEDNF